MDHSHAVCTGSPRIQRHLALPGVLHRTGAFGQVMDTSSLLTRIVIRSPTLIILGKLIHVIERHQYVLASVSAPESRTAYRSIPVQGFASDGEMEPDRYVRNPSIRCRSADGDAPTDTNSGWVDVHKSTVAAAVSSFRLALLRSLVSLRSGFHPLVSAPGDIVVASFFEVSYMTAESKWFAFSGLRVPQDRRADRDRSFRIGHALNVGCVRTSKFATFVRNTAVEVEIDVCSVIQTALFWSM